MTTLPAADIFNNPATTNGQAKQAQDDMLAVQRQNPGGEAMSELTIAAGSITPTTLLHSVDTELDAASDDLDAIGQSNLPAGSLLFIRNDTDGRAVVVKHGIVGAGQVLLADGQDLTLDSTAKGLLLRREGTTWAEVGRFLGGASFAAKQATVESFTDATVRALTRDDDGKLFLLDASTAAFNVPLPAVANVPNGTEYRFRMIGGGGLDGTGNRVTIDGSGAEVVELDATYELLVVDHEVAFRSDGTKWVRLYENRPRIREVFTASGTWTRPEGVRYAKATVIGGGGSGAKNDTGTKGGGGAGGSTAIRTSDFSASTSIAVTVGGGGAGVTGASTAGIVGGDSTFSTLTGAGGSGGGVTSGGISNPASGGDLNMGGEDGTANGTHMWTAPGSQGAGGGLDRIACGHMSGLWARPHAAAGQDGFRDGGSKHGGDLSRPMDPTECPLSRIDRSHHLLVLVQVPAPAGRQALLRARGPADLL
jgi:hypothetical protein